MPLIVRAFPLSSSRGSLEAFAAQLNGAPVTSKVGPPTSSLAENHEQRIRQHRTQSRWLHGTGRNDHGELGQARVQELGR